MRDYEIARVKKGFAYERNGYIIKGRVGRIYPTYDEAEAAAQALPETTVVAPTEAPVSRPAVPQRDRSATHVANLLGLPASKANGRCHYCELPLTNGYCGECG